MLEGVGGSVLLRDRVRTVPKPVLSAIEARSSAKGELGEELEASSEEYRSKPAEAKSCMTSCKRLSLTKMKSLMYEDWYKIEIPASARGAESSLTRAPEFPIWSLWESI